MSKVDQARIVALQKQVHIAKKAMKEIVAGYYTRLDALGVAADALDKIDALDRTPPLQGLVGHGENV